MSEQPRYVDPAAVADSTDILDALAEVYEGHPPDAVCEFLADAAYECEEPCPICGEATRADDAATEGCRCSPEAGAAWCRAFAARLAPRLAVALATTASYELHDIGQVPAETELAGVIHGERGLERWLADNGDDTFGELDPAEVRALPVGGSLRFGGGAAPLVELRRVR